MKYTATCLNYNFCSNYPFMCFECASNLCGTASYFEPIENHHKTDKEKTVFNNQKFKIFFGTYQNPADVKVNMWNEGGTPGYAILNGLTIKDMGAIGENLKLIGGITDDTQMSAVLVFGTLVEI